MSKVLVDRELLERIVNTNMADYAVIAYQHKEIRFILEAQPAEAEGAVPVICYLRATPDGTPEWSEDCVCEDAVYPNYDGDETVSMPLVRQTDHLAALSAVTAERDRLRKDRDDCVEARVHYAGKLGEVMAERDQIRAELDELHKDAERFRHIERDCDSGMRGIYGDDWVEVIDGYIAEYAAMAAKEA